LDFFEQARSKFRQIKILGVDDCPMNLLGLKGVLAACNVNVEHQVHHAFNGR
jgi:hypothetical protein